ncbi:hypothetical protein FHS89_001681 [Rubricella aquisinus]|uniref:DUF4384 domain-containing protein n=1 Tax=Rubricella aquisinus TaxID=2028108 RepID=A0A840WKT1_9RHOB|nr:hypothetical protein [Rubricella aquisinus]MBB5515669.1 hypothetical protein [Rubricella aquisinus]
MRVIALALTLALLPLAAVSQDDLTRAEQISLGQAAVTQEERQAFVSACRAWQDTLETVQIGDGARSVITLDQPLFVQLFTILDAGGTMEVVPDGDLPNGGISELDMCDPAVLVYPEGTLRGGGRSLAAVFATRFRPDRDLATHYPTAYPVIQSRNAEIQLPSGQYILVPHQAPVNDILRAINQLGPGTVRSLYELDRADRSAPILFFRNHFFVKWLGDPQ